MEWSNNYPFDYVMEVNQTACSYLKQFDLKDNVILSVCNRDGEMVVVVVVGGGGGGGGVWWLWVVVVVCGGGGWWWWLW